MPALQATDHCAIARQGRGDSSELARERKFADQNFRGQSSRIQSPMSRQIAAGTGLFFWRTRIKTRRWEIAVCDRRTVHMPYGNGSLHILKEDVVALVAELQRLYYGARLTDARPNSSTWPSEAIHNPGGPGSTVVMMTMGIVVVCLAARIAGTADTTCAPTTMRRNK
jgi:hypothetical protein